MDNNLDTISAEDFGRSLGGFGINLVVSDVNRSCEFLHSVFDFSIPRQSQDFAILLHRGVTYQLHADHTYSTNPLLSLLPDNGPRGGGIELRLYQLDPDQAQARAEAAGYIVLQSSADKPHGLRECFLLDPDGYCWVPSIALDVRG